jgi:hypothetical protein
MFNKGESLNSTIRMKLMQRENELMDSQKNKQVNKKVFKQRSI